MQEEIVHIKGKFGCFCLCKLGYAAPLNVGVIRGACPPYS